MREVWDVVTEQEPEEDGSDSSVQESKTLRRETMQIFLDFLGRPSGILHSISEADSRAEDNPKQGNEGKPQSQNRYKGKTARVLWR